MKRIIRAATTPQQDAILEEIKKRAAEADYEMTVKSSSELFLYFKNSYGDPEIYVDAVSYDSEDGTPMLQLSPIVRFPSYEFGENDDANPGYLTGLLADWSERVGGFVEYLTELQIPG